ncbi:hypothetical protein EXIGLDRAFT_489507 [Exidia glandulosa HHB12029]|uniref:Uncharacterized protein n=1 Tax=Exidia glandulosa HHB12029 TaxID=1314781 RepID=A0A166ND43_EXIGL|nr:hypothetical protein EXIGLDRAFT_489507 [Exidia glandulosa HHB12029]
MKTSPKCRRFPLQRRSRLRLRCARFRRLPRPLVHLSMCLIGVIAPTWIHDTRGTHARSRWASSVQALLPCVVRAQSSQHPTALGYILQICCTSSGRRALRRLT